MEDEHTPKILLKSLAEIIGISGVALHKKAKNKKIVIPTASNKAYLTHEVSRNLFGFKFPTKRYAAQIVKGGTGKTTCLENISSCANALGAKVLKIDIDPQGNLTDMNGVDASDKPILANVIERTCRIEDTIINVSKGMDIIPSSIENVAFDALINVKKLNLKDLFEYMLEPVINNYDLIFIDCPPNLGHSVTAAAVFTDCIITPLNPDKFSKTGLEILKGEIDDWLLGYKKKINLKVFLNKFSSKTLLSDQTWNILVNDKYLKDKVMRTIIPFAQEIPNTAYKNTGLFTHFRKSGVREEFLNLTIESLGIEKQIYAVKTKGEKRAVLEREYA